MDAVNGIQSDIKASALELIGNTPLLALDRLYTGPGRILAKCEFMGPGASIKDRTSLYMINKARETGDLKPNVPIVEVSSGNQGCGLAVVCAVLGHPLTVTMPRGNSVQRAIHMEALGAKCIRVPQVEGTYGSVTYADAMEAMAAVEKLSEEEGVYWLRQSSNPLNSEAHYYTTGPEIWRQSGHRVDGFVAALGTAGTFVGVSKYLKEVNPSVKCYVVEPAGSEPIKGCEITKPLHMLQGSGYGFVPYLFEYDNLEGTFAITDEEALKYTQLIGEKEGLYVGYTSGANVAAAIKMLESGVLPKDAWVVTVLCDSGLKYTPVPDELK